MQQQIDDNLRRVYSDTVEEPLPDRFTQLLEQLRAREGAEQANSGQDDASEQSEEDDP